MATLLQAQSGADRGGAQFLVSTFHPQLVSVAERALGVSQRHRVSRVERVQRADALEFVEAQVAADRAGGG